MQFTGKVTVVGPVRSGVSQSGTPWASQQFVMEETSGQYPKSIVFDVFNDKVALSEGEVCTVHLETKAREYNGKYFADIKAWKKEGGVAATHSATQQAVATGAAKQAGATLPPQRPTPMPEAVAGSADDLPF